jgi:transcriptional regulator with XRE-family HTH domain
MVDCTTIKPICKVLIPFQRIIEDMIRFDLKQFGGRIREIRGRLTQIKFGEKFGLRQAIISRLEKGDTQHCDLELIYRICKENDPPVSVEWLFTGVGEQFTSDSQDTADIPVVDSRLHNIVRMVEQLHNIPNFKGLVRVEDLLSSLLQKETD